MVTDDPLGLFSATSPDISKSTPKTDTGDTKTTVSSQSSSASMDIGKSSAVF